MDTQAGTVPPSLEELWQRADLGWQQAVAEHDHQGIASAVAAFEQAEDLAAQTSDPNHGAALINLVNALLVQAEECYSDAALDKALQLTESHDHLFSDHPLRLAYLGKRGRALLVKAQRTGDLAVMRRAVQVQRQRQKVADKRHPQHVECMLDLGVSLIHSSVMADSPRELDEAVAVLTAAKRRLDSSVDPAAVLSALGNARLNRFLHVTRRDPADLAAAIEEHTAAVDEMTPGDANVRVYLSDLGAALMRDYEHTGNPESINSSVARHREAVDVTPDGHARKAERIFGLASALLALHESGENPEVLDEAVVEFRAAVGLTVPGHAHYARCLYGLASALFRRGELRGMMFDYDEAAVLAGHAVEATWDGHANRPGRLAFYAVASCALGVASELAKADEALRRASGLLRHDNPALAQIQSNHGVILEAIARNSGDDPAEAMRCAREAVRLTRQAVETTPRQHSEYNGRMLNFAAASATWARLAGDATALDAPLDLCTATQRPASPEPPDTLLELARAQVLSCRYELTKDTEAAEGAIRAYQYVAEDRQQSTIRRLNAACLGADIATRSQATGPAMNPVRTRHTAPGRGSVARHAPPGPGAAPRRLRKIAVQCSRDGDYHRPAGDCPRIPRTRPWSAAGPARRRQRRPRSARRS